MAKWEYKLITTEDLEKSGFLVRTVEPAEVEKYFNSLGREGWEIISLDFIDTTAFIDFKGVAKRRID